MNNVFEIIKKRRSVRKYKSTPVEDEKIYQMIEAARLAPSASNGQPWKFVAVKSKDLILNIADNALGIINRWAKTAPLLIVGCAVKRKILTHFLGEAISGISYHILDLGIAMEHIVLEAEDLGLSTCWIGWFNENKIKNILDLPHDWKIGALLAVGYKDENLIPRQKNILPVEDILIIK
jgi:nitroreductase